MKRKNNPIEFVDQRMEAPASLFKDKRARIVRVFCLEHTVQGIVAHTEISCWLMSFPYDKLVTVTA